MIGKKPSEKMIQAMRIAVGQVSDKFSDKDTAYQIWKDFRWRLKTINGDYKAIAALLDEFTVRAEAELKSVEIREEVARRFSEMCARVSEFSVEPDLDGEEEQ